MSSVMADLFQNGNLANGDSLCSVAKVEECDFSKLLDRPRPLNIKRQRSCDERSMSELSIGLSPRLSSRHPDSSSRIMDHLDYICSQGWRSGANTPRSQNGIEPHPKVGEAWEALRSSLVQFRDQPVGTIAAFPMKNLTTTRCS